MLPSPPSPRAVPVGSTRHLATRLPRNNAFRFAYMVLGGPIPARMMPAVGPTSLAFDNAGVLREGPKLPLDYMLPCSSPTRLMPKRRLSRILRLAHAGLPDGPMRSNGPHNPRPSSRRKVFHVDSCWSNAIQHQSKIGLMPKLLRGYTSPFTRREDYYLLCDGLF